MTQYRAKNTNNQPLISIITVVYNALEDLRLTVQSVMDQQYWPNFEYIIVDGASTDGTLEYLQSLPSTIRYISEPDQGIYDAMNKGLKLAKGKAALMLNAGDTLTDDAIQNVINFAHESNLDLASVIIYGDAIRKFGENEVSWPASLSGLKRGMTICHQASYIGRNIHKRFGNYSTDLKLASDYEFFLRIYKADQALFKHLPMPLAKFNYEGSSSSQYKISYSESLRIAKMNLTQLEFVRFYFGQLKSKLLRHLETVINRLWLGHQKPDLAYWLYKWRSR